MDHLAVACEFEKDVRVPEHWVEGVEHMLQEGRMISILASRNVDAIAEQARSLPNALVERLPVTLREMFLEHVRNN